MIPSAYRALAAFAAPVAIDPLRPDAYWGLRRAGQTRILTCINAWPPVSANNGIRSEHRDRAGRRARNRMGGP